jgi:hypothetical protein
VNDRDNQQEIPEVEKAWLAGIIEGDGSIGMGFQESPRAGGVRGFAVKPTIAFSNQDVLLVERVTQLLKALSGKNAMLRELAGNYPGSFPTMTVSLVGMKAVQAVLEAIHPYLYGMKSAKSRLLRQFLESRMARIRTAQGNPAYNEEELIVIQKFYRDTRRKGGKRNPEIGKILNDYMCAIKRTA